MLFYSKNQEVSLIALGFFLCSQSANPVRTPMMYFADYFTDNFFVEAAHFTNMYSVLKNGASMNTDSSELKRFFGINLHMGCFPFPRLRLYWQREYSLPAIADCMARNRFLALRNSFHLVDIHSSLHSDNKLWKVQPIINAVRNVCLTLPRDNVSYSIDEQMIPFTGRCHLKQYVKTSQGRLD